MQLRGLLQVMVSFHRVKFPFIKSFKLESSFNAGWHQPPKSVLESDFEKIISTFYVAGRIAVTSSMRSTDDYCRCYSFAFDESLRSEPNAWRRGGPDSSGGY